MRYTICVILLLVLVACTPQAQVPEPSPQVPAPEPAPQPVIPAPACVDSDGGINKYERGVVQSPQDTVSDACLVFQVDSQQVPLKKLVEYSCEEGKIVAEMLDCEYGCEHGACLAEAKPLPPEYKLVDGGECQVGLTIEDAIRVTACYNDCLVGTRCEAQPFISTAVKLPAQLNCLARDEGWVVEKWLEFEVLQPIDAAFAADVVGSEVVLVKVWDSAKNLVAAPINERVIAKNKCFEPGFGFAKATLRPGRYEVHIGARATAPDMFRSFRGKDFSVSFVSKV